MMTSIISGLQGTPPQGHPAGYPFLAGRYQHHCISFCLNHCNRSLWCLNLCLLSDCSKNVIACAKHFVGDGGTDKGLNEGNTICSYEELERIHMRPYLDCLAMGVCTVMASYSSWNGRPLHSDRYLITDILKNKLGFKVPTSGALVCDFFFLFPVSLL